MKRGLVAGIDYDKIQGPTIATFPGSKFAMLILSDVRPESRSYIAPLQDVLTGKAHWTQVTTFEDEVTDYDLHGDDLILLHNHGFSRGRLVKTSAMAPNLATATEIVPQGDMVIERTTRAKDGLYIILMDGGISRLRHFSDKGQLSDIALPFDGTLGGVFTTPNE